MTQPGIIPGDVYVRIKIKRHKEFQRRGADLVHIKKITLLEALTGVTLELKHLDGKKHTIATAPGEVLKNEELKTVKGLGLPFYKDAMSYGNLYIEFFVQFPKKGAIKGGDLDKVAKLLKGVPLKSDGYSKNKSCKILEEYSEGDLNSHPAGGAGRGGFDEEMGGQGGSRQVRCEQQ